jgi:hypothetical protein
MNKICGICATSGVIVLLGIVLMSKTKDETRLLIIEVSRHGVTSPETIYNFTVDPT